MSGFRNSWGPAMVRSLVRTRRGRRRRRKRDAAFCLFRFFRCVFLSTDGERVLVEIAGVYQSIIVPFLSHGAPRWTLTAAVYSGTIESQTEAAVQADPRKTLNVFIPFFILAVNVTFLMSNSFLWWFWWKRQHLVKKKRFYYCDCHNSLFKNSVIKSSLTLVSH